MTDLTALNLAQARDALREKQFSAIELVDAHLAAIDAAGALNAYILKTPDRARAMARASDEKIARGDGGALEGLPLGIKDLFSRRMRAQRRARTSWKISCPPTSRQSPRICGVTGR